MSGEQQIDFFDSGFTYSQDSQAQWGQNYSEASYGYNSYAGPSQGYSDPGLDYGKHGPSIMTPRAEYPSYDSKSGEYTNFEDEPPLLEELGINFDHIWQKTQSVLNPLQQTDPNIMDDTDIAGPLVFCIAFGAFLLLSGKVHGFGYIYGVGVLGCLSLYAVLNLMSMTGVTLTCVISVLGYCILPMVILSGISVILTIKGSIGTIFTAFTIIWCSYSASKLFVTVLAMDDQQLLVAYPCALLYGVFALLTVF